MDFPAAHQGTDWRARINSALWLAYSYAALVALFAVPMYALNHLLPARTWSAPLLAVSAALAAVAALVAWRFGERLATLFRNAARDLATTPTLRWMTLVIAGGLALRLIWVLAVDVVQTSDHLTYWLLAEKIVRGEPYFIGGTYANWPPGLPYFLAAHFFVFGIKPWVGVLANLLLYCVASLAAYRLAREIGGEAVARIAVVLLAIWPNHIMCTELAKKELLIVPLLAGAVLAYLLAVKAPGAASGLWRAGAAGLLLGAASLTQPSLMLLPSALVVYELVRGDKVRKAFFRLVFVAIGMVAAISPWSVRNYVVLDAFVPISTAGGRALHGSNNDVATGGYLAQMETALDGYDEVAASREGFQRGREWIAANPGKFMELAFHKQVGLLGDDSDGVYWGLKRGSEGASERAFLLLKGLSNAYWLGIMFLTLVVVRVHWRSERAFAAGASLLMLSLLYVLAIDTVFEAGGRHHIPMTATLAALAALIARPLDVHVADRRGT